MAPHDLRRPFKRAALSDQQRRRDISLQRQAQNRRDAQHQARLLALTTLSFQNNSAAPEPELEYEHDQPDFEIEPEAEEKAKDFDVRQAASLRGPEARRWFAKQLMLPEWMIDVPDQLNTDWYSLLLFFTVCCLVHSYFSSSIIFYLFEVFISSPFDYQTKFMSDGFHELADWSNVILIIWKILCCSCCSGSHLHVRGEGTAVSVACTLP